MRGIEVPDGDISCTVEGFNELDDRVPVLRRIHVHYALRIPPGSRETVDRVLERHVSKCPTARSLVGAVEVTWSADVSEAPL